MLRTKKLVGQGYTLNLRYTFESFMVGTMIYYNTPLSQFLCDLVICWCVIYIHRIWPHRIWLVILLIPRRVRGHSRRGLLFPGIYSYTWVFPSVSVVLSVTLFSALSCLWTDDFRLLDDGRLFPSLYFLNVALLSCLSILVV